jgi:hypothetical protein
MIAFIVEILFFSVCGWIGHIVVKGLTLGKIDLDYGDSSESIITELIGVGILLALAVIISLLINANAEPASGQSALPVHRSFQSDTNPEDQNRFANKTVQDDTFRSRGFLKSEFYPSLRGA